MASREDTILAHQNRQNTQQESGMDTSNDLNGAPNLSSGRDNTQTRRVTRGSVSSSRDNTIIAYKNQQSRQPTSENDVTNIVQQSNSTESRTEQSKWPSHARRCRTQIDIESGGQKKKGRGVLKGIKVAKKRFANGSSKLHIEFSKTLGGSIGENYRLFVDDVVVFMKRKAPLIGVNKWSNIDSSVTDSIVADVIAKWDLEDTYSTKGKILTIARERYRGWRSTLHSTYKAYNTDDQRRANKPEDVTPEEWDYMINYFGTDLKFQELSQKNTENRQKQKARHIAGSKWYSQISYEKRDEETGKEPTILQLWQITHTRNGSWSNKESQTVYDNAHSQIREKEGEIGGPVSSEEQNDIFQSSYRCTMESTSLKPRGHGYMAKPPSGSERLHSEIQRKNAELALEVHDLRKQIVEQQAEWQREREEERVAREKQLEEERVARQRELEEAKQAMMQDIMNEVRQSMRSDVVQILETRHEDAHQFSQARDAPRNGTGNQSSSKFKSSSMITQHQLMQAAKHHRRRPSEKDGFL
ncbi:rac guanine nucleotide exchange factor JJ-like isoform X2 [Hordeum vulgare subsp. vulgare]|uniref:rac guanine nucleotide exchange factor JJ-like isoform X2 n=1 Tax=Hordeum vulgare subsp. vulgare TaxID=112509 RepID=UPI001D1A3AAF|nr:rac guanine nucleotide exchange factor JJ-like isoform X2 [Hordeum vulgare subsp. vulgare]